MKKRLVHIATGVALSSEGIGRRNSFRIGALLLDKSRILVGRTNSYKTHPKMLMYNDFPHIHAESNAILTHGEHNCEGLDLLVVRVWKDNKTLSCAKPCGACMELITQAGIKRVFYSDWNGEITCQKI